MRRRRGRGRGVPSASFSSSSAAASQLAEGCVCGGGGGGISSCCVGGGSDRRAHGRNVCIRVMCACPPHPHAPPPLHTHTHTRPSPRAGARSLAPTSARCPNARACPVSACAFHVDPVRVGHVPSPTLRDSGGFCRPARINRAWPYSAVLFISFRILELESYSSTTDVVSLGIRTFARRDDSASIAAFSAQTIRAPQIGSVAERPRPSPSGLRVVGGAGRPPESARSGHGTSTRSDPARPGQRRDIPGHGVTVATPGPGT